MFFFHITRHDYYDDKRLVERMIEQEDDFQSTESINPYSEFHSPKSSFFRKRRGFGCLDDVTPGGEEGTETYDRRETQE